MRGPELRRIPASEMRGQSNLSRDERSPLDEPPPASARVGSRFFFAGFALATLRGALSRAAPPDLSATAAAERGRARRQAGRGHVRAVRVAGRQRLEQRRVGAHAAAHARARARRSARASRGGWERSGGGLAARRHLSPRRARAGRARVAPRGLGAASAAAPVTMAGAERRAPSSRGGVAPTRIVGRPSPRAPRTAVERNSARARRGRARRARPRPTAPRRARCASARAGSARALPLTATTPSRTRAGGSRCSAASYPARRRTGRGS